MIQWTKAKDLATLVVRVTAFLLWLLLCVAFSKSDCQNALYNPDRPDDDSTPEDVTVPRTRRQLLSNTGFFNDLLPHSFPLPLGCLLVVTVLQHFQIQEALVDRNFIRKFHCRTGTHDFSTRL